MDIEQIRSISSGSQKDSNDCVRKMERTILLTMENAIGCLWQLTPLRAQELSAITFSPLTHISSE
jgi:hypothetical protein